MKKFNVFVCSCLFSALLFSACDNDGADDKIPETAAEMQDAAASATPAANNGIKKYGVKSGIITYENTISEGIPPIKSVVYFDDWGMKECKETYNNGALKEAFFSNGKNLYLVLPAEKTAYNRGNAYSGTEMKFNVEDVQKSAEYMKKDGKNVKVEVLPKETIAGKECEVMLFDQGNGNPTKFAGWQGITLLTELQGQIKSVNKATDIKTDVPVPADKFAVPAGYAEKKY
jgi:hypothetical protein